MSTDGVFQPDFDPGRFRYAVARLVKRLMRARYKLRSGCFDRQVLQRWELDNIDDDSESAWQSLEDAAEALKLLNTKYIPRCGSGGVPITDQSTPIGRLVGAVGLLVVAEGGAPYHNQALIEAAELLRTGKQVDLDTLVDWSELDSIRDDLDQLPHLQQSGTGVAIWSQPKSPKYWATKFGISVDKMKTMLTNQEVRNLKLTNRSYRIHREDLPARQC